MKEIYRATSQNGRWGLALVSEGISPMPYTPVQATMEPEARGALAKALAKALGKD